MIGHLRSHSDASGRTIFSDVSEASERQRPVNSGKRDDLTHFPTDLPGACFPERSLNDFQIMYLHIYKFMMYYTCKYTCDIVDCDTSASINRAFDKCTRYQRLISELK